MAALSANIEENFLECGICLQNVQDPRDLPCLHTFCCECLRKSVGDRADRSVVICPVCKKKSDIPDGDMTGFPAHYMVNNLIASVQKTKYETAAITCTNCDISATATVHCTDCQEYLCHNCHKSHMTFKAMRNHKIVTLKSEAETKDQTEKTNDKEGYCKLHNEGVRYYCRNEEKLVCPICVSEKTCHIEHDRISLKDKENRIASLKQECEKLKVKYADELEKTTGFEKELSSVTQLAKNTLSEQKKEFMEGWQKRENNIYEIHANGCKEFTKIKDKLTSTLVKIDKANDQGSSINLASSEQDVIDTLVSLTEVVYQCSTSPPSVADKVSLDRLKLEIGGTVKNTADIIKEEWKHSGQFNLPQTFIKPQCIAINQFGDIAVTDWKEGVVVLSRTGQVKCYFANCPKQTGEIAVTPDNRFIVPGNTDLLCYGSNGLQHSTINVADKPTRTSRLAVDKWGRVIAYTRDLIKPWSIHYADGVKIASFKSTDQDPYTYGLEATYTGDIVYCQPGCQGVRTRLRLMDYLGGNVRVINPPPHVTSWRPVDVCCSKQQSEIYVANDEQPVGVYKYTAQGDYISCVTTDINKPIGITLSPDEKELFVVEKDLQVVKIFQRQ